jgi:membrane peptidoglycan carboxypeptidase
MSPQNRKPTGALGAVAGLVGFSVVAGVLVTAMVAPALAVTSATAQGGIAIFEDLPEYLELGAISQQNEIYGMRGAQPELVATIFKQNRREVDWENVSPFLKDAAVAGEDRRFFEHGGVDVQSVIRAGLGNLGAGSVEGGGSTLTMQLVKNILIQQALELPTDEERKKGIADAQETSIDRKLKEMKLAIGLEKRYSKNEILLAYLNIAGFGGNTYGVEAAAREFFSVSAKDVTPAQAASLIAIVQQPSSRGLKSEETYEVNTIRRNIILDNMLELGYLDQAQHDEAVATDIATIIQRSAPTNGCRNSTNAALACDYVTRLIASDPPAGTYGVPPELVALGDTPSERKSNWSKGGYKVYTSIDLDLQQAATDSLAQQAPPTENRFQLGGAAVSLENGSGRILVMAQNRTFDDSLEAATDPTKSAVNFAADYWYGGSTGFPTGSTYKVPDLANWLQQGHGLGDLVDGSGPQDYQFSSFSAPCAPEQASGATFKLKNDGNSRGGTMTVRQALIGSVNNAFMHMAQIPSDLCSIRDTAASMGAHRADGKELFVNPNTILGQNEQSPLAVATTASTVGAGGLHCEPIMVDKIVDSEGKELPGQAKTCDQALTPDVAAGTLDAMAGSMQGGTSSPGNPRDRVAIGGKTGTSNSADHVWIMGTTTKVATAVWTGNVVGDTSLRKFTNPVTGRNYASASRFNVFKAIMVPANAKYGGDAFPKPSAAVLGGSSATVPDVTGQAVEQAKGLIESLKFRFADGGPTPSALPAGKVVRTDPGAGAKVPNGATITVFTSDGSLATTVPNVVGQDRDDALAALVASGFVATNVTYTWVNGTPANVCEVQAQNPGGGAAASKADPVTLTVYGTPAGTDPGAGVCPL